MSRLSCAGFWEDRRPLRLGNNVDRKMEVDARVHSERRHQGASPPSLNVKIKPTLLGNQ